MKTEYGRVVRFQDSSLVSWPSRVFGTSFECAVLMRYIESINADRVSGCSDNNFCCLRTRSDCLPSQGTTAKGQRKHGDKNDVNLLF